MHDGVAQQPAERERESVKRREEREKEPFSRYATYGHSVIPTNYCLLQICMKQLPGNPNCNQRGMGKGGIDLAYWSFNWYLELQIINPLHSFDMVSQQRTPSKTATSFPCTSVLGVYGAVNYISSGQSAGKLLLSPKFRFERQGPIIIHSFCLLQWLMLHLKMSSQILTHFYPPNPIQGCVINFSKHC